MTARENDWVSDEGQAARFQAISKVFDGDMAPQVLDVGCGTGDYYFWLKENGYDADYLGIDTDQARLTKGFERGIPYGTLGGYDFWKLELKRDYLVASGTFAYQKADARDILAQMWNLSHKGFAVTFLSEPRGELAHYSMGDLSQLVKAYDYRAVIIHDYLPHDFTVIVRKDTGDRLWNSAYEYCKGTEPTDEQTFRKCMRKELSGYEEYLDRYDMAEPYRKDIRDTGNEAARRMGRVWEEALSIISSLPESRPRDQDAPEVKALTQDIVAEASDRLRDVLQAEMEFHALEADPDLKKQDIPLDELGELIASSPVWRSFEGLKAEVAAKIEKVILDAYTGEIPFDMETIVDRLRDAVAESDTRLERIARTEMTSVVNGGREIAYRKRDPEEEFRHRWVGPDDKRTSDICKEITKPVKRLGGALPLSELKALVKEVSTQFMGPRWIQRPWTPHPNCRHMVLRRVR